MYSYRELFRQDGIALEYSSDRAEYGEVISGDPERLKQVFCNLLDNAAKHGGSGKRIAVHLSQQEGEYVITIRDFGPGIPEAELPYVKQKFYKGSSKARGSGIGLAVCGRLHRSHGVSAAEKAGGTGIVKKQKKLEQVLHFTASCAMLASERNSADLWKRKRALSVPVSADRR